MVVQETVWPKFLGHNFRKFFVFVLSPGLCKKVPMLPEARKYRHLKEYYMKFSQNCAKETKTQRKIIDIRTMGDFSATFASSLPLETSKKHRRQLT